MKVLLDVIASTSKSGYNATGKARLDVTRTLTHLGYTHYILSYRKDIKYPLNLLVHLKDIFKLKYRFTHSKAQEIIIQYPGHGIGTKAISLLTKILKPIHITILIHDIDSLRYHGEISQREIKILNRADKLIVHTPAMMNYLIAKGVSTPMKVLELFDYYALNKPNFDHCGHNSSPYSLVFAGNLSKSLFLEKIGRHLNPHSLHLYGLPIDTQWPDNIIYEGKFSPDDIDDIKGDWGLVWDGDEIESCDSKTSYLGNYLKYNSSHKASLYIASGKPLIVWKESALSEIVMKYRLGICIDSLTDIPAILKSITLEQYNRYKQNVEQMALKLRNGEMLKRYL